MTLVTGTVQDLGYDGMEGTLWARPARFRSDGQVVLAPERKPYKVTGGVVSADLAPGPAVLELQVGSHARGTFEVVIPDQASITLADLLDTVFTWEPAQVSLFVAEREAAEAAKRGATAAAADAELKRKAAADAAQVAAGHRTHVDTIRETLDEAAQNNVAPYLTTTALNATYAPVVSLAGRGVSHTATASVNTAAIRAGILEAEAVGATVVFPPTPPGQSILINDSLPVAQGGIRITGAGKYQTRIRQTGWIKPIFDVTAPNVVVDSMWLDQAPYGANNAALFRGEPMTSYNAGVWVGADNVEVRDLHTSKLVCSVHFASWNVTTNAVRTALRGCSAHNISSDSVVFNLLAVGVAGFQFSGITGTYGLNGTSTPPHLVYFSEGLAVNTDTVGSACHAWGSPAQQYAYQFKGMSGARLSNLTARNCTGYLHVMESTDVKIAGGHSIGDTASGAGGGAAISVEGQCSRIVIDDVTVDMAVDSLAVVFQDSVSDSTISNARIISRHTSTQIGDTITDVMLKGARNTAENVTVTNVGPNPWGSGIAAWGGSGHRIINPVTSGNQTGVVVRASSTNVALLDYDPARIAGVGRRFGISNAATGFAARPIAPVTAQTNSSRVIVLERGDFPDGTWSGLGLAATGQKWTHLFGTWLNEAGKVRLQAAAINGVATIDTGLTNIEVEAGAVYDSREAVVVRVSDRQNLLGARANHATGMFELYKADAGAVTVLASVAFVPVPGVRYLLRIAVSGSAVSAVLDNGLASVAYQLTPAEATKYTATTHGLLANTVAGKFDSIVFRTT